MISAINLIFMHTLLSSFNFCIVVFLHDFPTFNLFFIFSEEKELSNGFAEIKEIA